MIESCQGSHAVSLRLSSVVTAYPSGTAIRPSHTADQVYGMRNAMNMLAGILKVELPWRS